MSIKTNNFHQPVMLDQVIDKLAPQKGESYLDLTAGYGGHAGAILNVGGNYAGSVLVDRDSQAIEALEPLAKRGVRLVRADFLAATLELSAEDRKFDMILMDLGLSSPHLNNASRGFAFSLDGPLDMRMDQRQGLTAEALVNRTPEAELVDILRRYGEERQAAKIALAIVKKRPISTTSELAEVILSATGRRGKIHPATKTFQALRIAINDELGLLEKTLPVTLDLLNDGGRLAIISFHSLEDRIVKNFLSEHSKSGWQSDLRLVTKKPITASHNEIVSNPRARSAKLRVVVKIKT